VSGLVKSLVLGDRGLGKPRKEVGKQEGSNKRKALVGYAGRKKGNSRNREGSKTERKREIGAIGVPKGLGG